MHVDERRQLTLMLGVQLEQSIAVKAQASGQIRLKALQTLFKFLKVGASPPRWEDIAVGHLLCVSESESGFFSCPVSFPQGRAALTTRFLL